MVWDRRAAVLLLAACLALLVVPGCGFKLRGSADLPAGIGALSVQAANPYSQMLADLRRALQSGGVTLVDAPQAADTVMRILGEESGRRVLSVQSTGRVREYELYYTVSFDLTGREGRTLVEPQNILLTRDYVFDETGVLGNEQEEALLFRDMQRQAVRQILQRVQAAYANR